MKHFRIRTLSVLFLMSNLWSGFAFAKQKDCESLQHSGLKKSCVSASQAIAEHRNNERNRGFFQDPARFEQQLVERTKGSDAKDLQLKMNEAIQAEQEKTRVARDGLIKSAKRVGVDVKKFAEKYASFCTKEKSGKAKEKFSDAHKKECKSAQKLLQYYVQERNAAVEVAKQTVAITEKNLAKLDEISVRTKLNASNLGSLGKVTKTVKLEDKIDKKEGFFSFISQDKTKTDRKLSILETADGTVKLETFKNSAGKDVAIAVVDEDMSLEARTELASRLESEFGYESQVVHKIKSGIDEGSYYATDSSGSEMNIAAPESLSIISTEAGSEAIYDKNYDEKNFAGNLATKDFKGKEQLDTSFAGLESEVQEAIHKADFGKDSPAKSPAPSQITASKISAKNTDVVGAQYYEDNPDRFKTLGKSGLIVDQEDGKVYKAHYEGNSATGRDLVELRQVSTPKGEASKLAVDLDYFQNHTDKFKKLGASGLIKDKDGVYAPVYDQQTKDLVGYSKIGESDRPLVSTATDGSKASDETPRVPKESKVVSRPRPQQKPTPPPIKVTSPPESQVRYEHVSDNGTGQEEYRRVVDGQIEVISKFDYDLGKTSAHAQATTDKLLHLDKTTKEGVYVLSEGRKLAFKATGSGSVTELKSPEGSVDINKFVTIEKAGEIKLQKLQGSDDLHIVGGKVFSTVTAPSGNPIGYVEQTKQSDGQVLGDFLYSGKVPGKAESVSFASWLQSQPQHIANYELEKTKNPALKPRDFAESEARRIMKATPIEKKRKKARLPAGQLDT